MNRPRWGWIAQPFRRAALPLAAYYAVTLVLPVAHGASRSGGFLDHALVVLLVPPILIVLGSRVRAVVHGRPLRLIFHRNFPAAGICSGRNCEVGDDRG